MCSMGGGGSPDVKPLTPEEMKEMTDNPFKNPNSGVSAPSWKPEEVKKEIAAQEAAREKLKVDTIRKGTKVFDAIDPSMNTGTPSQGIPKIK